MKRLPLFLAVLIASVPGILLAADTPSAVREIPLKELLSKNIWYSPISLSEVGNRNFKDDPKGEGPGWSGQGENSVYDMTFGKQVLDGIPFDISSTPHHQCLVLRGQNNASYPVKAEIPVGAKGQAVYFLHATAWSAPLAGTYTVNYSDGTMESIPLRNNTEIFDWWDAGSSAVTRAAWTGANPKKEPVALFLFAWANPHPGKNIKSITAETTGDAAYLMLAGLTVASEGPYLVRRDPKVYKTADWFEYEGIYVGDRRKTALDMSALLDAPAGKHGAVVKNGEAFAFEDGAPARFWGTNIVASANFPDHGQAEWMAEALSQLGVNMTRHHHMDAPWTNRNLYGKAGSTLKLDRENMDRFDYLVAQLQKRGIYQYFDLIVNRPALASDGVKDPASVPNGYKIVGEFDETLLKLQEDFIREFLNHKNPYTDKTYSEDKAVALMEIMNEDSLFYRSGDSGESGIQSQFYRDEWNALFNRWLLKLGNTRQALAIRWTPWKGEKDKLGLRHSEDPKKGTVECIGAWTGDSYKTYCDRRIKDTFRFYYETQLGYYKRIVGLVRGLGSKTLITGSNHWVELPADLYANAKLDYIDRHNYWAHPNGGYGYSTSITFEPGSMVKNSKAGIIEGLAEKRVKGLPYIVTEWQASAPNDYRQEGAFIMGAYSCFQGWNALQFAFSHSDKFDGPLDSNFNIYNQPGMIGVWPAASLMFHRQDVTEDPRGIYAPLSDKQVFNPETRAEIPARQGLISKTGVEFTGAKEKTADFKFVQDAQLAGKTALSTTGELTFDHGQGIFKVNTDRTQGFCGFPMGKTQATRNLEVALTNDYGLVVASSLSQEPLSKASRILVSAIGNAINKGMELEPAGNRLKTVGALPILVEPMVGLVKLTNLEGDLSKSAVWALNPSGKRKVLVPFELKGQTLSFQMQPVYKAMHYEIIR